MVFLANRRSFMMGGGAAAATLWSAGPAGAVSLQAPLWAGSKRISTAAGAPMEMMLFYPTDDVAVAPLANFGSAPAPSRPPAIFNKSKLPIVIFLHGQDTTFLSWSLLPATLARAGFFVIVPDINPDASYIAPGLPKLLDFIQHRSEIATLVDGRIGVAGHSFGAAGAMQWAADNGAAAFAGLSGQYAGYGSDALPPYSRVHCPTLIVWGSGEEPAKYPQWRLENTITKESIWDPLPQPKHLLTVENGGHFDYLPPGTPGLNQGDNLRGPCADTPAVVADVVTAFFSKYMQASGATLSNSLVPPLPQIPPASALFASCFVPEMKYLATPAAAGSGCQFTSHWQTGALVQGAGDLTFSVARPSVGVALVAKGVKQIARDKVTIELKATTAALANARISWKPSLPGVSVTLLDKNGLSALLTFSPIPAPLKIGALFGSVSLTARGDCGRTATLTQGILLTPAALNQAPPKGSGTPHPLQPL